MKKIKIGQYDYKIIRGPIASGDEGLCLTSKLEIHIAPHENPEREIDTLLHECLHALWDHYDLGNTAEEEPAVRALAGGVLMLLRDNPQLRALLLDH